MTLKTDPLHHQQEATEKLSPIRIGALYMEMGTGKTRTALSIIRDRVNANKIDRVIWFCPCSVKTNLQVDLRKHVHPDYLSLFEIHGIESLSSSDRLYDYLLKSVNDRDFLIVDESNLIKNHYAIRTRRLTELSRLCRYRMILNGTPITCNEKDLYSQWYFLDWRVLGYQSFWSFAANHLEYHKEIPGKIVRVLNTDYLSRKIAPYSYQVLKKECLDLPDKTYDTRYFSLTDEQREHYIDIVEAFTEYLNEYQPETVYRMLTAAQLVVSGRRILTSPNYHIRHKSFFNSCKDNPRIGALRSILSQIYDKVIIWTKYEFELDEISEMLVSEYSVGCYRKHNGKMSLKDRTKAIDDFEINDSVQFLIINKNCGQYGLNLQFCSNEIFYSNDFNYGTRMQAEDRIHRIGQTKKCLIGDICAYKTIDGMIQDNLSRKENLVDRFRYNIDSFTKKEISKMLTGEMADG